VFLARVHTSNLADAGKERVGGEASCRGGLWLTCVNTTLEMTAWHRGKSHGMISLECSVSENLSHYWLQIKQYISFLGTVEL
jgi:hypothetical protein